jgi:uncharacterized membrane protein YccF (DUF307 family)
MSIENGYPNFSKASSIHGRSIMNFIGNIIWLVFGGIISAVLWFVSGLVLCVTIIGIPFGFQCFKIAGFVLWPFGREVEIGDFGAGGLIFNVLWLILFGWEFAVAHVIVGAIFCMTIIGIPFGLQHFKFAKLGLIPFGARIYWIK